MEQSIPPARSIYHITSLKSTLAVLVNLRSVDDKLKLLSSTEFYLCESANCDCMFRFLEPESEFHKIDYGDIFSYLPGTLTAVAVLFEDTDKLVMLDGRHRVYTCEIAELDEHIRQGRRVPPKRRLRAQNLYCFLTKLGLVERHRKILKGVLQPCSSADCSPKLSRRHSIA
ncbi:ORF63 [Ranid herpesvirus 2]|uniref:ORF63 n=1 Tax=Ranid herpesvirus 2 TaxID=389214 RepID=Q14W43_9VIRU|nr:ORF63 [Ranid herpesvirus 2]ABG25693.1 ORF63 [Ranid herpesvirus 2]